MVMIYTKAVVILQTNKAFPTALAVHFLIIRFENLILISHSIVFGPFFIRPCPCQVLFAAAWFAVRKYVFTSSFIELVDAFTNIANAALLFTHGAIISLAKVTCFLYSSLKGTDNLSIPFYFVCRGVNFS